MAMALRIRPGSSTRKTCLGPDGGEGRRRTSASCRSIDGFSSVWKVVAKEGSTRLGGSVLVEAASAPAGFSDVDGGRGSSSPEPSLAFL